MPAAELRRKEAKIGSPIAFDLFWNYRRLPATPANVLRAMRAAIVWGSRGPLGRIAVTGRFSEWITKIPLQAIGAVRKHGHKARAAGAGNPVAQFADIMRLAANCSVEPKSYHDAELYRPEVAAKAPRLVQFECYATIVRRLTIDRDAGIQIISRSKETLSETGAARGLPTVPTLARIERDGRFPGALPRGDLIVKPILGAQGKGIEGWRFVDGGWVGSGGERLDADAFGRHLQAAARTSRRGILLQPRLVNHPALAAVAGDALSTTRVCTMMNEAGEPEIVEAFLRASLRPGAVVDNYHAGGILYPVDPKTGVLGTGIAMERGLLAAAGPAHAGERHPVYDAVAETALRAHRAFPTLFSAGWDIAMTPDGPVVVEANIPHGISIGRQLASGSLVDTRLGQLLVWHARRWIDGNMPPASRWRVGAEAPPAAR